eukprot:355779-Chlamydomonas_euryale.AAC.1
MAPPDCRAVIPPPTHTHTHTPAVPTPSPHLQRQHRPQICSADITAAPAAPIPPPRQQRRHHRRTCSADTAPKPAAPTMPPTPAALCVAPPAALQRRAGTAPEATAPACCLRPLRCHCSPREARRRCTCRRRHSPQHDRHAVPPARREPLTCGAVAPVVRPSGKPRRGRRTRCRRHRCRPTPPTRRHVPRSSPHSLRRPRRQSHQSRTLCRRRHARRRRRRRSLRLAPVDPSPDQNRRRLAGLGPTTRPAPTSGGRRH